MKPTGIISLGRHLSRRSFSALPTRHSRSAPAPACLDATQLKEGADEVLGTSPGALIPYEPSKRDDSLHAWEVADEAIQKVEWLIRGYSAQVQNTSVQALHRHQSLGDPSHCLSGIQQLLDKMEKEGKLYMDMRRKMRSQLAVEEQGDEADKFARSNDLGEAESEIARFASPGQTITMFDTLLDTMCVATDPNTPELVGALLSRVNDRFEQDGGHEINVNPNTVPTQMTFNAGIRAIANTQPGSEKTRDDALMHAFVTFESLRESHAKRNAATYAHMLQVVAKFIPASQMAGNVAHGLWHMAKDDQVIDTNVMRAMEMIDSGNDSKYENFMEETIRGKEIHHMPQKWRKFGKAWRYLQVDDTY